MTAIRIALATASLVVTFVFGPASAETAKAGGTLRVALRDNPPSASILEESTISVNMPFMSVYNNLVFFDPHEKTNSADKIVPELAVSWSWSDDKTQLSMKLRDDVKWHDGKPFTSADVVCTWDDLSGKAVGKGDDAMRKNPRKIWYKNLKETKANGPYGVTFVLGRPQPSFLSMLAAGYSPVFPCHVPARIMRTHPIGTGPFKFVEFKRNESIRLVKNPDYWKKGRPFLDAIEWRIIPNRSTRVLAFSSKQVDITFDSDITFPMLADVKKDAPNATCEARPTNVNTNLIVNREAPPFNNAQIRRAMALALDRKAFISILSEGHDKIGASMLPPPAGKWGMPQEKLERLTGYGPDRAKNLAEAKKIMEGLGYSDAKPLNIKVATRNIAVYRDPAVILIDQLKQIYIAGELEPIDTSVWYAKILRKDYQVGLNLTGVGVDDPDVNYYENFSCGSERNYTGFCDKEIERLIDEQSAEADAEKRRRLVWAIDSKLVEEFARPVILHGIGNTCWHPELKGLVLQHNSIYNGWRLEDVWLDR